ncbi:helix-turn-helix domain-containing protein [Patulibacter minatonensis]|uniref:helix-turn-helix domain-containing protein n=1 Tax=Patulibacter minatonensis TaxID=298163 RepID=UPI00047B6CDC|nr:GAF domain-containing protein [Patulibacter minatonensis]
MATIDTTVRPLAGDGAAGSGAGRLRSAPLGAPAAVDGDPAGAVPPTLGGSWPDDPARRAARAFGEVLAAAGDREGLDAVLRPAAVALCRLTGVGRCSLYLLDARTGRFRGRLGHPRSLDPAVKRLTMAGPSDALTADVLRTGAPVAVADVDRDPRATRSAMRDHHVRSVLGVPMVHAGRVLGLAYVDDEGRRHEFTPEQQAAAAAFCTLVARWIDRSLRVAQLGVTRDELARERTVVRRATLVERRLAEVADGTVDEILTVVAELAGRPVEVVDGSGDLVARSAPGTTDGATLGTTGSRGVLRRIADVEDGQGRLVEPDLAIGLTHRCMAAPLSVDGGSRGFVALVEQGTRVGSFDLLLAVRAAAALTAAGRRRRTVDLARDDARALLFAQLLGERLHGGDVPDLAARLGVHDGPRLVVTVEPTPAGGAAALEDALRPSGAAAVQLADGVALVLDAPLDVASRAAAAATRDEVVRVAGSLGAGADTVVGVSSVCRDLDGLPRALDQVRALLRSAGQLRPSGVDGPSGLTVDELGPARLLLTDASDAGRMGEELLGPLLDPDPSVRDLLRTLTTFFACASSIRGTATELDVHENTVRHRFGRIRTMTGLDVAGDVDDQLMARAALSALRLAGATVLTFDD